MNKYLRVINIDGTRGCGRSTQISLLSAYFTKLNIPYRVNRLENDIQSGIEIANKTIEFLKENEDHGVVINDGSPARMMVMDLVSGMTPSEILSKYRDLLFVNEQINHAWGTASLLLILDDLNEANKRIKKRQTLLGLPEKEVDLEKESDLVKAMSSFDVHPISKGLKFDVINIDKEESMLEISERILEYLQSNFEIKKPCLGKNADQAGDK